MTRATAENPDDLPEVTPETRHVLEWAHEAIARFHLAMPEEKRDSVAVAAAMLYYLATVSSSADEAQSRAGRFKVFELRDAQGLLLQAAAIAASHVGDQVDQHPDFWVFWKPGVRGTTIGTSGSPDNIQGLLKEVSDAVEITFAKATGDSTTR